MDERIGVVGKLTAMAGKEDEMASFFEELSALAKAHEPGMLQHAIFRSRTDPKVFVVVEVFRDQAGFDAHSRTPHYAAVGARMGELIDRDAAGGGVEVMDVIATGG